MGVHEETIARIHSLSDEDLKREMEDNCQPNSPNWHYCRLETEHRNEARQHRLLVATLVSSLASAIVSLICLFLRR